MIDSVLPFLFSKFVCCLALAYTGPTSYLRPFSSLLVAVCCFLSAQSTLVGMVPGFIGGEYVIGFVLQANNLLCLSKSAPAANLESSGRLRWASYEVFNHRGGLPDQQIPLFDKNSPQRVPSRRSFLLHQLSKIVLAGAAIFLLTTVQPSLEIDDWLEVPSGFLRRLPSLSSKEALIRVYMAFITHAVPYASLQAAHALSACIAVAYGDSPTHWRPIFGDIQDAWSMRNYYRSFWHSLMRKAFTVHAIFFNNMLRLPRKSQVSRFVLVIITFALSALMHLAAVPLGSLRCSLPTIAYYLDIAGAIILEHLVLGLYQSFRIKVTSKGSYQAKYKDKTVDSSSQIAKKDETTTARKRHVSSEEASRPSKHEAPDSEAMKSPKMQWRLFGYCWVVLFTVWNTSRMIYATEQCAFEALVEKQMASNETLAFL